MRKLNITLLLTLSLVLVFSLPAFAYDEPDMGEVLRVSAEKLDINNDDVQEIITKGDFDTMRAITKNIDGTGTFTHLDWIAKSTYAPPLAIVKYQTGALSFKLGEHTAWVSGESFRTQGKPGETLYERITITREAFVKSFSANSSVSEAEINRLLDTEEYIYAGAWIIIYDDKNANGIVENNEVKDGFWLESSINTMAGKHFSNSSVVKTDWQSRFQKVKLNPKKAPDFFSTPEGETEWKEEYLVSAKTYKGDIGEEVTFPVTLYNQGETAITDFRGVWGGEGDNPTTGWKGDNAPFIATNKGSNLITIEKGESMTFDVTVKVPNASKKLYFKANIDGKTPKSEINQDNNIMVITIVPDGFDLAVKLTPNKPVYYLPPDLGYVYPIVTLQGTINKENIMLFVADGYFKSGTNRQDFTFAKMPNQEGLKPSFGFKATKPGKYKVRGCIPALDKDGNPVPFNLDMGEEYDINPANNCDEVELEVKIGDPIKDGGGPIIVNPPKFEDDDENRIGITG